MIIYPFFLEGGGCRVLRLCQEAWFVIVYIAIILCSSSFNFNFRCHRPRDGF